MEVECKEVQIKVFEEKWEEFEEFYVIFFLFGVEMKWLECKIDVVEWEYFSIFYSLGLVKFKQQSIEMKFNYMIVELAYYLFIFKFSKWKILVVVVGVMGFVFMVFMILFLEFLDINIKDVCWVEKKIGLFVIVIYFKLVCWS